MKNMPFLPDCKNPKETYGKLAENDEETWQHVIATHKKQLQHDIKVSLLKGLRDYDLTIDEYNIEGRVFEIEKQTWINFRAIITNPSSNFKYLSHEESYKYLRKTSWFVIRKLVKKLHKEVADQEHYSLDAIEDSDLDSLDSFLYRNGGYVDEDPEQDLILKLRIQSLLEAIDILKKDQPKYVEWLIHKTVWDRSSRWISEQYSVTEDSVNTILSRVRSTLRELTFLVERKKKNNNENE